MWLHRALIQPNILGYLLGVPYACAKAADLSIRCVNKNSLHLKIVKARYKFCINSVDRPLLRLVGYELGIFAGQMVEV